MRRDFDLLGDPIPDNFGKPGANGHIPTKENVNKVRSLVSSGWTLAQIADELGIKTPTLRKHYFQKRSIKTARVHSIREAKGRVRLQLEREAEKGNVSAMKEINKMLEKEELDLLRRDAQDPPVVGRRARPIPKGKREILEIKAERALEEDPDLNPGFMN